MLGAEQAGKPQIVIAISDSLVKERGLNAVEAIRAVAKHINGGGGGQAFFANAGGKNAGGLQSAIDEAKKYFAEKL